MSKNRNVNESNSPSDFPEFPINIEALLRGAEPNDVTLDRDDLFFQAGFAAGSKRRNMRMVWPAIAASLVCVAVGLGVALLREAQTASALQVAVGKLQELQRIASTTANQKHSAAGREADGEVATATSGVGSLRGDLLRNFRKLATNSALPPGQLTAGGSMESPSDLQRAAMIRATLQEQREQLAPASNPRSPTFFELRMQQEG